MSLTVDLSSVTSELDAVQTLTNAQASELLSGARSALSLAQDWANDTTVWGALGMGQAPDKGERDAAMMALDAESAQLDMDNPSSAFADVPGVKAVVKQAYVAFNNLGAYRHDEAVTMNQVFSNASDSIGNMVKGGLSAIGDAAKPLIPIAISGAVIAVAVVMLVIAWELRR